MKPVLLIINAGSSSIKFAIYTAQQLHCVYRGQIQGIGINNGCYFLVQDKKEEDRLTKQKVNADNHQQALEIIIHWLAEHQKEFCLEAVGHRIVHGGSRFTKAVVIDADVIRQLQKLVPLAPLHQPHNLAAIEIMRKLQPSLIQVACFDTAFHHTQPEIAKTFALPKNLYNEGIRSYGFHGLSYEYIASILSKYSEDAAIGRTIIAHLGHGASLCAMHDSKSMATTMTFTPLDGLPMGTRCGSIDPAVVLYLLREKQLSVKEISDLLHYQSGLLGLSGITGDMQVLLNSDSLQARSAIDVYVYRIMCEIGKMAAAIHGFDCLIFTAGIGEHSALIREKICLRLAWLGIEIEAQANHRNDIKISTEQSPVSVLVIPTNEEKMIAAHTYTLALGGHLS
jgi:acetate kinase